MDTLIQALTDGPPVDTSRAVVHVFNLSVRKQQQHKKKNTYIEVMF